MKASELIYQRLHQIIPMGDLRKEGAVKLTSDGWMALHVDLLSAIHARDHARETIAMAHYFEQNGDLVPDPDMEIILDHASKRAIPVHYQNQITYRRADDSPEELRGMYEFLLIWTKNLIEQGHKLAPAA